MPPKKKAAAKPAAKAEAKEAKKAVPKASPTEKKKEVKKEVKKESASPSRQEDTADKEKKKKKGDAMVPTMEGAGRHKLKEQTHGKEKVVDKNAPKKADKTQFCPPSEPMPTLMSGSVIETKKDTPMYRSPNCGTQIDTIPVESVLKILEQNKSQKEICVTQFAGKQGYIRIIDDKGKLCISAAEKKTLSVNFKNFTAKSGGQLSTTLEKVMTKYEISEGQIIEALYLLNMREGEDLESDAIEEITPKTKVIVLKIGQGRRVRIRKENSLVCGWVSAIDARGKPLLGYILADVEANAEYEVGARLEVKSPCKFTMEEAPNAPTIGHTVKPGSIVIVQAIGSGELADRKVKVSTEDSKMTGWVYVLGSKGETVLGSVGHTKDSGRSNVKLFLEGAKGNNLQLMTELLGLSKSKGLMGGLKKPAIKDPNVADVRGKTALFYACGYGHYEAVKFLCGLSNINVHLADDFSRTALHYSCKRMPGAPFRENQVYARICSCLVEANARVDERDDHGATGLMFAAFIGDLDTVKTLEKMKADVNLQTFNKRSASIMAAINGHRPVVNFLITKGAPPEDAKLLEESSEEEEEEEEVGAAALVQGKQKAKGKAKAKGAKAKAKGKSKAKAKAAIAKAIFGDDDDNGDMEIDDVAEKVADMADKPEELKKYLADQMKSAPKMKYSQINTLRTIAREATKLDMSGADVEALQNQLEKLEAIDKMAKDLQELVDSGGDTKKVKALMEEAKKAGLPDKEFALESAATYLEKEKPKDEMKAKLQALADKGDFAGLESMVAEAAKGVLGASDLEEFQEILKGAANIDEAKEQLAEATTNKDVDKLRICIPMCEKFKVDVSKAKAALKEEEPKYEARKAMADAFEKKDLKLMKTVLAQAKTAKVPDDECKKISDFITAFEGLEKAVADTKTVNKEDEDALSAAKSKLATAIKAGRAVGIAESDLFAAEQSRKKFHNMLEDLKGAIRVFCRVRPISKKEIDQGDSEVTKALDGMTIQLDGKEEFIFDAVWTPGTQADVFEDTKDLIQSAIDGFNVTIFAYGQTGAGKTFTMTGVPGGELRGVIPRACDEIFVLVKQMEKQFDVTVMLKMMELYNSDLKDLLAPDKDKAPPINVRVDKKGVVIIDGVQNTPASDARALEAAIDGGFGGRTVKATAMNSESSRSHLVVIITMVSVNKETNKTTEGKLLLCDLAGSERIKKSEVTGAAQKEAIEINKSLTALGNVIEGLTTGSKNVPYRDHKLTMLMQDALGGTSKTLMFMNCSPAKSNIDETTMSLKYAQRAKKITNKRDAPKKP
eukprot:GEMP01001792.1.p1 GENE.GEMP01001792.1~~GEMP01001792.1.p1  ORF type:complete len:1296 (+),score=373.50 GEMP01001792.1:369-4256(+)